MFNNSRRTLLKGLASSSALMLSGLSSLVSASSSIQATGIDAEMEVHLLPTGNRQTKTLKLFNHGTSNLTIEGIDQLDMGDEHRVLAVKVAKPDQPLGKGSITLTPGESGEFTVAASRYHQGLKASNEMMPFTVFDAQVA